jgi:putative FmdB family regulatory protein
MPARYDYKCDVCGHEQEQQHGMSESPEFLCPVCGHAAPPMRRMISSTNFALKGTGWYASGAYSSTETGDRNRADKIESERAKNIKAGKVKPFIKTGHR